MEVKRGQRSQFNPANIKVNRGNAIGEYARATTNAAFQQIDLNQNVINDQLNKYIVSEEKKGAKLGKSAEIVYEDVTYYDDEDNKKTHKIARSYKTPEHLISTSWAANKFQEEVEENYLNAMVSSASTIIEDEKNLSKLNTNFGTTVAEATGVFDNNINPALDVLRQSVPDQYAAVFDFKVNALKGSARTELANKQLGKLEQLNEARANASETSFEDQQFTRVLTNPDLAQIALDEETKKQFTFGVKGSLTGFTFKDRKDAHQNTINFGGGFSTYLQTDYSDEKSVAISLENIDGALLLLNMDGQTVPLRKSDMTVEMHSLESLGIDPNIPMDQRKKLYDMLKRHKIMLQSKFTENKNNESINEHMKSSIAANAIADTSEKTMKLMYQDIMKKDSFVNQRGIAVYVASRKNIDPTYDTKFDASSMFDPEHRAEYGEYMQFMQGTFGIFADAEIGPLKDQINDIAVNDDPTTINVNNLLDIFQGNMLQNINNNSFTNLRGTKSFVNMKHRIGLSDEQKDILQDIQFFSRTYGRPENGGNATIAVNKYINYLEKKKVVNDGGGLYSKSMFGIGINDREELRENVNNFIMKEFSDKNFRNDVTVYAALLAEAEQIVVKKAYEKASLDIKLDSDYIELLTEDAVTQLLKNGDYQVDEYTYQVGGVRDDRDEFIKDKLGKYGIGKYLNQDADYSESGVLTNKGNRVGNVTQGDTTSQAANKILRQQYYDKMVKKEIYIDRTPTWHAIQRMLDDNINWKSMFKTEGFKGEKPLFGKDINIRVLNPNAREKDILYEFLAINNPEGTDVQRIIGTNGIPFRLTRTQILKLAKQNEDYSNKTYNLLFSDWKKKLKAEDYEASYLSLGRKNLFEF